jgi:hypothetical protein
MSTQQIRRMLRDEYPEATIDMTGSGHIRLRFPDGAVVIVSSSPSKNYFMKHVHADVKRAKARLRVVK